MSSSVLDHFIAALAALARARREPADCAALTAYTTSKSKGLSDFLDAISDEQLTVGAKMKALAVLAVLAVLAALAAVWRRGRALSR